MGTWLDLTTTFAMPRLSRAVLRGGAGGLVVAAILGSAAGASAAGASDARASAAGASAARTSAQVRSLLPPQGGEVRALVIGIDAYQFVPPLKGAVADARDIEATLRRNGAEDVTALIDAAADRAKVMRSVAALANRSRQDDLVILTIAGHGAQEPEHIKGSQPDGMDNVVVLAGFNPKTRAGSRERIIGTEFNHIIKEFEARGVRVVFVADASYGGGLEREIDPRAPQMSYRQAPRYTLAVDDLHPISTKKDALLSEIDFRQTAFLGAVDRKSKAPEVHIPGVPGVRGALSYAVARALEGAADENGDGAVTEQELFSYVRQVAYQLSDQRQNVVTAGPAEREPGSHVVFARTRAVAVLDKVEEPAPSGPAASGRIALERKVIIVDPLNTNPQQPSPPAAKETAAPPAAGPGPAPSTGQALSPRPAARPAVTPPAGAPLDTVRVAVLGDQRNLLDGIQAREARFEIVATTENPDLVWDPASRDVLTGADVVARGIDRTDLPSVIDRLAAVNGFKRLAAKGPQSVRVLPDDRVYRRNAHIDVQVSDVAQRSLLIFNIAGDGTVQTLYPIGSDPAVIVTADQKVNVQPVEPYGADQVVAVTSLRRLDELEQALKNFNQRRTAVEVYRLVERYAPPPDARIRIGATSLYTAP
jgi:hypothetical protein